MLLCYLVTFHSAFAQVHIINGSWEWPDQGLTLNPEGDTDGGGLVYDLLPYENTLVVGGGFLYAGGIVAQRLAVWDGQSWSTIAEGFPNNSVNTLMSLDGALYIGGIFNFINGVQIDRCAKWDGETWSELGDGLLPTVSVRDLQAWADGTGSILFAATQTVFRWDGKTWSIPGGGLSGCCGGALALEVFDDGTGPALYVAGNFKYAGGVLCNGIAKWNGEQWSSLGQGLTESWAYGTALAVFDDGTGPELYLGGHFTQVDGQPIATVARWNGESWSAVGDPDLHPGTIVEELRVLDDGSGPALYLADVVNVQRWDGKIWRRYPSIYGTYTMAIFPGPDGPALHIGGGLNLGDNQDPRYTNIAYFVPKRGGFACGDFNGDGHRQSGGSGHPPGGLQQLPRPRLPRRRRRRRRCRPVRSRHAPGPLRPAVRVASGIPAWRRQARPLDAGCRADGFSRRHVLILHVDNAQTAWFLRGATRSAVSCPREKPWAWHPRACSRSTPTPRPKNAWGWTSRDSSSTCCEGTIEGASRTGYTSVVPRK